MKRKAFVGTLCKMLRVCIYIQRPLSQRVLSMSICFRGLDQLHHPVHEAAVMNAADLVCYCTLLFFPCKVLATSINLDWPCTLYANLLSQLGLPGT